MLTCEQVENLNAAIQEMDRDTVTHRLTTFRARFPVDFTHDFLKREPLPRLRHILFGLCLHNQQMIDVRVAA